MKLARMNAGKPGRPFRILKVLLRGWLAIYTFLQMPYRQMEGFVRKLATFIPGLVAADYTTLFRRIRRLDLSLEVTPEKLTDSPKMLSPPSIAPGSRLRIEVSGCARSGGSGVAGSRCNAMVDIETNQVLGLEITDESVQDDQMFILLLDQTQAPLRRGTSGDPGTW